MKKHIEHRMMVEEVTRNRCLNGYQRTYLSYVKSLNLALLTTDIISDIPHHNVKATGGFIIYNSSMVGDEVVLGGVHSIYQNNSGSAAQRLFYYASIYDHYKVPVLFFCLGNAFHNGTAEKYIENYFDIHETGWNKINTRHCSFFRNNGGDSFDKFELHDLIGSFLNHRINEIDYTATARMT